MKKIIYLTAFSLMILHYAQSQAPTLEWANRTGGNDREFVSDMFVDDAGNIYMTGGFMGLVT